MKSSQARVLCLAGFAAVAAASSPASPFGRFELSLKEAERRALDASAELKALSSNHDAATEQASAQYASLLPRLTLGASYQYLTEVPTVNLPIPGFADGITFGSHNNYSFGPTLSYTLWDTGAARDAYHGYSLLAQSREEDRKRGELQLLLSVRAAYVKVQLSLEELKALGASLDLARAQNRDIEANFRAGAATRLDQVDSQREVLNYRLQFEQKRSEVAADLKDLLALTRQSIDGDLSSGLELKLDSLASTLDTASQWPIAHPGENHPQLRGQELLAESSERAAQSQRAGLYPTLQVSASALIEYPNTVIMEQTEQNIFAVTLSMPLFEGSRIRHLSAEKAKEAEAALFNLEQSRIDLGRDYDKAVIELKSLRAQRELAVEDVKRSEDAARLYYRSYRGGKINLIDVESANNRALTAKVNAARIDAAILNELFALQSLSGEITNGQ